MASSSTEIWNLALGHLGSGKEISDQDERSAEAAACRRFYETARDEALRAFPWPFAKKVAALGEVTNLTDDPATHPSEEWEYQYQMPSDCLYMRKIQSGARVESEAARIPYEEYYGTAGTTILTDAEEAVAEYTIRVEDVSRFPADFVMAVSRLLAHYIAPSICKSESTAAAQLNYQHYMATGSKAASTAAGSQQPDVEPDAPSILARN